MHHHLAHLWRKAAGAICGGLLIFCMADAGFAQQPGPKLDDATFRKLATAQIGLLLNEKAMRTPAQRKLDSHFVLALEQRRGTAAAGLRSVRTHVALSGGGTVSVEIQAEVTPALLDRIQAVGGSIVGSYPRYQTVRASVPIDGLESIASLPEVHFIARPAPAHLENVPPQVLARMRSNRLSAPSGPGGNIPIVSSHSALFQGDVTHQANLARSTYSVDGTGVKIGVLSDSVDSLQLAQSTGYLPANVTVLSGQANLGNTGEGTAMLEVIHKLAPGAQLYFATGSTGAAQMATNIVALQQAGCNIICDDIGYGDDPPFQDGIIAQAIDQVTAGGVLYFSAAGNDGNFDDDTSSAWEGEFVDGGDAGTTVPAIGSQGVTGRVHSFGNTVYDTVNNPYGDSYAELYWSDPQNESADDYDLFALTPTGAIDDYSTNAQSGESNPYEAVNAANGDRLVIVKVGISNPLFMHLDILTDGEGTLSIATTGNTSGHNACSNAFTIAATDATLSYPNAFSGGFINPVEFFSSDGPRQIFFSPSGKALTPGNFTSSGGQSLQKPDFTAADGINTSLVGFAPFYGTSCATPHAAAIAALLLQVNPSLTKQQVATALGSSALSIATGSSRDWGSGIIMAPGAVTGAGGLNDAITGTVVDQDNAPISGVTITLTGTGANSTFLQTTTTSGTGTYAFFAVPQGAYVASASLSGYNFSPASPSVVLGATSVVQNFTGTIACTITCTVATATGGPLNGVSLTATGQTPLSTTTATALPLPSNPGANGAYTFTNLAPGSYKLFPTLAGYSFTPNPALVTIASGTVVESFLGTPYFTLSGVISSNATTPSPLSGITVTLTGANTTNTVQTDVNGNYSFANLPAGTYTVAPTPPSGQNFSFTPPSEVIQIVNQNVQQNFSGGLPSISGRITSAATPGTNPLAGVTVSASNGLGTAKTDANGNYSFLNVPAGSYTLTASLTSGGNVYLFSPSSTLVTVNSIDVTQDFSWTIQNYQIAGTVTAGGVGVAGVTIDGSGGLSPVSTDSTGAFAFTNVPNGNYTLTVVLPAGYACANVSESVTVQTANATAGFVFLPYLGGTVATAGGAGVPGVTIAGSPGLGNVTTGANGSFVFPGVPGGTTYNLTASLSGYVFVPSPLAVSVGSLPVTGQSIVATLAPVTYSITGNVTTSGGSNPLADVTISAPGLNSATSLFNGTYSLSNVIDGSYILTPSLSGYAFSPSVLAVTVNGADVNLQNFVATPVGALSSVMLSRSGGSLKPPRIRLAFTGALDPLSAGLSGNYSIAIDGQSIPVLTAQYSRIGNAVTLTANFPQTGGTALVRWSSLTDSRGKILPDGLTPVLLR